MPVTLTEIQRIPTSGARAAEPVPVAGFDLLAESVVCEWTGESLAEFQRISSRWALTPDLRFAAHTVRYELRAGAR
jgi:hypothetical protein